MLVSPGQLSWSAGRRTTPSLAGSPQFRLDLSPALERPLDAGLTFSAARVDQEPIKAARNKGKSVTLNVSYTLARLLFASQCMIVFILVVLIGGMSYTAFRMSSNASYYISAIQPYVDEARTRGMHILRNADESSQAVHNMATGAEILSSSSLPAMAATLNRTTEAVAHMADLMQHPTLKLSME